MDPVSLIVAALVAGAAKAVEESVSEELKEGYRTLRGKIAGLFRGKPLAEAMLTAHENDPKTYEAPLRKELELADAQAHQDVVDAAQVLLQLADPAGVESGRYVVGSVHADRGAVAAVHIEGGVTAGYGEPPGTTTLPQ